MLSENTNVKIPLRVLIVIATVSAAYYINSELMPIKNEIDRLNDKIQMLENHNDAQFIGLTDNIKKLEKDHYYDFQTTLQQIIADPEIREREHKELLDKIQRLQDRILILETLIKKDTLSRD